MRGKSGLSCQVSTQSARASGSVLLLVEDEVLIRMMLARDLRERGYTVVEAGNADHAWRYLTSGAPCDLLVSDIRMPGSMDGVGLAARVRAERPALPVVLVSARIDEVEPGTADALLRKPYDPAAVAAVVRELLDAAHGGRTA